MSAALTRSAGGGAACSVVGCGKPIKSKGMCKLHYDRTWRTGSPHVARPCLHGTPEERFWRHVERRGDGECWPWRANRDKDGYGLLRVGTTMVRPHRLSWELVNGPIPDGLLIRHRCNNPPCCNPAHMLLGTHADNMQDRAAAGNYAQGQCHHNARVTNAEVGLIREAAGTYAEIAARFGISASQVGNIRRGTQRRNAVDLFDAHPVAAE